ncbi:MAG: TonB-dependent receptor plug domain-containing protein, partial [Myxococcota bacterium]
MASCLFAAAGLLVAPAARGAATIRFAHKAPSSVSASRPVVIRGVLKGAEDVDSLELFYRTSATKGWLSREIESETGEEYATEIPAAEIAPPTLEYYVVAVDFLENRIPAFASERKPQLVTVAPAPGAPTREADNEEEDVAEDEDDAPSAPARVGGGSKVDLEPLASAPPPLELGMVTRIERRQIAALGARDLVDVLRAVPEVDITRDVRGFFRVALRGQGRPGDVLLEVDDLPLLDAYDGEGLWDMPAALIDSVEIHRQPGGSLAAPLAPAGVVKVRTRTVSGVAGHLSLGSYASRLTATDAKRLGTATASLLGGGKTRLADFAADVAVHATDGSQREVTRDAYSGALPASTTPGPLRDARLTASVGLGAKSETLLPGRTQLAARYFFLRRGGYVGAVDTYSPEGWQSQRALRAKVNHEIFFAEGRYLRTQVGFGFDRREASYELSPPDFVLADRNGDGLPEVLGDAVREQTSVGSKLLQLTSELGLRLSAQHALLVVLSVGRNTLDTLALERNLAADGMPQTPGTVAADALAPAGAGRTTLVLSAQEAWQASRALRLEVGIGVIFVSDQAGFDAGKNVTPSLTARYRLREST